jgi:cell division protein FtsB
MKATGACKTIGYALEDSDQEGTIQVFAVHGENSTPQLKALSAQVQTQAGQLAAQQQQIEALVIRLTALEQNGKVGAAPAPANR